MKLVHFELSSPLISEKMNFTEWIIEAPQFFSLYVQELLMQKRGGEGGFVLSEGEKELAVSKSAEIIFSPFLLDLNDRTMINKLYAELEGIAYSEKFFIRTQELKQEIYKYLFELEQEADYFMTFSEEIDLSGIFKTVGAKLEIVQEDLLDRMVCYIKALARLMGRKLFIFINLRSYLSDLQLKQLIQKLKYEEIGVLFLENQERGCICGSLRYIIDKDGCEIY